MTQEYFGAQTEAEIAVNELLNLPATGHEQDWEVELADPTRVEDMLHLLENMNNDMESISALALLTISSMVEAKQTGSLTSEQVNRASQLITSNKDLRERMYFYWIESGRTDDLALVEKILSQQRT